MPISAVENIVAGGDATTTAQDILTSEGMFRLAIAAFVVVAVLDAVGEFLLMLCLLFKGRTIPSAR